MIKKKIESPILKKGVGIKNKKVIIPKVKNKNSSRKAIDKKAISPSPIDNIFQRPKKAFIDSQEIPATYNKTNLTLIARDPYWIHAYWEISPNSMDELREKIGKKLEQSTYVLRMYDVTLKDFNGDNANSWFDIDLTPNDNNWYVKLWKDCVTYCGAVGIRTPDGEFFILAMSNFVTTPRDSLSGRDDMVWMDVPPVNTEEGRPYPFVFIDQLKKRKIKFYLKGKAARRRIYLTDDDIRAYYYNLLPLLRILKSKIFTNGKPVLGDLSNKDLEKSSIYGLKEGQYYKKINLGASEQLLSKGGASEQRGGASERSGHQRDFFFEIGTELIVYGRTEPDAEVFLEGKKIDLREDGTFSLRYALGDDTKVPLNFVAVSNDKKAQKSIATSAQRTKTMYSP